MESKTRHFPHRCRNCGIEVEPARGRPWKCPSCWVDELTALDSRLLPQLHVLDGSWAAASDEDRFGALTAAYLGEVMSRGEARTVRYDAERAEWVVTTDRRFSAEHVRGWADALGLASGEGEAT